jgi:hypothetical protein
MRKLTWSFKSAQKVQAQRIGLKFEVPSGFEELSSEETNSIVAGESAAYWLGYVAGKIANLFS